MSFVSNSLDLFLASCKKVHYIVPNLDSMIEPIRASSLRLMILDEWPETSTKTKGIPASKAGNFVAVDIDKLTCDFPISASSLETHYKQVISSVDKSFDKKVRLEVLTCVRNVCENLMLLDDKLENESAVRLAIGNPVVKMLCTIQGLFICVEEQLSPPNESRRSSLQSADGVTEKSAADYVCYTLYEHDSKLKLAAVVIEVKTDDVHVPSAVAQLMGYYLRSCTARDGHTIGLLLTPTQIHIFLFPFSKGQGKEIVGCVNAVWLQQLSYSTDDIVTTMGVLCVLAVVTSKDFQIALRLDEIFWPISKDYTFMIETEIEMMKKELEEKLETVEKEMEMIAIEKKKMAMKLKVAEVAIKKLTPVEIATISKSMQDCELEN